METIDTDKCEETLAAVRDLPSGPDMSLRHRILGRLLRDLVHKVISGKETVRRKRDELADAEAKLEVDRQELEYLVTIWGEG